MKVMKSAAAVALTGALLAAASAPAAQAAPPRDTLIKLRGQGNFCDRFGDTPITHLTATQAQWAIHDCVNRARVAAGVPTVKLSSSLTGVAFGHAQRSVQIRWWNPAVRGSSHTDPQTGSTPESRVRAVGYCAPGQATYVAENNYAGQGVFADPVTGRQTNVSARSAVNAWLTSTSGHRENLLNAAYTVEGVGYAAGYPYPGSYAQPAAAITQVLVTCR